MKYSDTFLKAIKLVLPDPSQLYSKEHIIFLYSLRVDGSSDGNQQVGVQVTLWSSIREPLG
jgi:hypothetical protein